MLLIAEKENRIAMLIERSVPYFSRYCKAASFQSAVETIEREQINLAIVSKELQDISGLELLGYFHAHFSKVPVIFVANDSKNETILSALRRGASDYLEWPFDMELLQESIERIKSTRLGPRKKSISLHSTLIHHPGIASVSKLPTTYVSHPVPDIEVSFFGKFQVGICGQLVDHWPSRRGKALFAFLAYHCDRPISRDTLMDQFWPKISPPSARNSLNVCIHSIRQLFYNIDPQKSYLNYEDDYYSINPDLTLATDVKRFTGHWSKALFLAKRYGVEAAISEFEMAASIYKEDFMLDNLYEDWTISERENLREIYLEVLENLSRIYSLNSHPDTAIEICKTILNKDNCREKVHRRLMLCYYRVGKRDYALRQFHKCTKALKKELDVSPSSKTRVLFEKIRDESLSVAEKI